MWHPLSSLFTRPQVPGWSEVDIRYVIQDYLQRELQADGVYCEAVKDGTARIRVAAPALVQQVRLLLFDVQREVLAKTGYDVTALEITR